MSLLMYIEKKVYDSFISVVKFFFIALLVLFFNFYINYGLPECCLWMLDNCTYQHYCIFLSYIYLSFSVINLHRFLQLASFFSNRSEYLRYNKDNHTGKIKS